MFQTERSVVIINSWHQKLRKLVNTVIVLLIFMSFVYIIYWQLIVNDDWGTFNDTKQYFLTISNVFFPDDTSTLVFRNTAFCLFACVLPVIFLYHILDYIRDGFISIYYKLKAIEDKKIQAEIRANELLQYDVIKYISICLSLDWDGEQEYSPEAKKKLNTGLYQKIKSTLSKTLIRKDIQINNTLAIKIDDFKNFDQLFHILLNILAKIKKQIEKNSSMELLPTITINAYAENEPFEKIEKHHFEIMKFNFKNKVLTNNLFVKKYDFLKFKKYKAYSIGDYATFGDSDSSNFELYVMFDNLNDELYALGRDSKN